MWRRFHLKWTIIQILLYIFSNMCKALPDDFVVEALLDGSAKMPCDVLEKKDDTVEFVFWYKNDGVTALYTLDARDRHLKDAIHMKNETYADRVNFFLDVPDPYLHMDKLREEDTGDYFCRVDYQWSATEIKKVELVVVVPPKKVVIRDDSGQEVRDIAGPYKERADVTLVCEAQRGFPSPNVTWWRDGKIYDNTFKKGSSTVVNEMRLQNLSRTELMATFQCKAQNTKLAPPVVRKIVLDLLLYPIVVQILGRLTPLSAGQPVEITCQTSGSRPPAKLSWWLNGTLLTDHSAEKRENETSSRLRLQPKVRHNGCSLACRAENTKLHDGIIEDIRILNITCGYTSSYSPPDQRGGGSTPERRRLCPPGLRGGLESTAVEGGMAVQWSAPFTQRISNRRRKWKYARFQATHKEKQGTLQMLRHQRGRKGCQPGNAAEHKPRTSLQGKPTDNVRSGVERECGGTLRGGGAPHRRHIQVGVQQHHSETLRPTPHEQRHRQQRHLSSRHARRLRDTFLLGKQQHRSSANFMLLHSDSTSLQAGKGELQRFEFIKRRQ